MKIQIWAEPCVWVHKYVISCRGTLANKIYGTTEIIERHRHRYEVNETLIGKLEQQGLKVSGRSIDGSLVEMIEFPIIHGL